MKKAIIFGSTGQMGSYLVELLKSKDYSLTCLTRWICDFDNLGRFNLKDILKDTLPDEIYNFVGINSAQDSWYYSYRYLHVNGIAVQSLLDLIKEYSPQTKFFQAGSAEVFEKASVQQYEDTNRLPENPYGLSKLVAMEAVRIYREKFGLFACTGIFFNAESPRRKDSFFAERVVSEAVRILKEKLESGTWKPMRLGSLGAKRDWGWAPEYVEVAWRMLQQEKPNDFVIGTGEAHSCYEFVNEVLNVCGLDDGFEKYVVCEKEERKSQERNCMRAMPIKAEYRLGWKAQYKFKDVIRMLVEEKMKSEGILGKSIVAG